MTNYLLCSGPFMGLIVGNEPILDIDFSDLPKEIRDKIAKWVNPKIGKDYIKTENGYARAKNPSILVTANEFKADYESSWLSEETDEKITLRPLSQSTTDTEKWCANTSQTSEYNLQLPIATLVELLRDEFGITWQGKTTRRAPILKKILELEHLKNQ